MFSRLTRFGFVSGHDFSRAARGLKQCWALAPAVFPWPSSATGREKLLSNLVFRAGLATAGAKESAEKLNSLKGTAFRPSVSDCNYVRALASEGTVFARYSTFFRSLFSPSVN